MNIGKLSNSPNDIPLGEVVIINLQALKKEDGVPGGRIWSGIVHCDSELPAFVLASAITRTEDTLVEHLESEGFHLKDFDAIKWGWYALGREP